MFFWDFNVIIALGITLGLGVVIAGWLFYTLSGSSIERCREGEFFRQCGFCGYLYFDYFKKSPAHCPRCGSYQSL